MRYGNDPSVWSKEMLALSGQRVAELQRGGRPSTTVIRLDGDAMAEVTYGEPSS